MKNMMRISKPFFQLGIIVFIAVTFIYYIMPLIISSHQWLLAIAFEMIFLPIIILFVIYHLFNDAINEINKNIIIKYNLLKGANNNARK